LVSALDIFGTSDREDWISRARHLLGHPRNVVRMAAARALARHGRLDASLLRLDTDPRLRSYALLDLSLASPEQDPLEDPAIANLLDQSGPQGEEARLGLLAGIADAPRSERLARLLVALETRAGRSRDATEALARAAASQQASQLVAQLISRLVLLDAREDVRSALLSFGRLAMEEVWGTLLDPLRER